MRELPRRAGVGGVAQFVITDQNGQFVAQVNWIAPALNTVLWRFNEDQVSYILNYGRPGTPMAAWGADGGGPLTTQQIDNVIDYLWSVQLTQKQMRTQVDDAVKEHDPELGDRMLDGPRRRTRGLDRRPRQAQPACPARTSSSSGEILFNNQELASGSYSCARCHVPGAYYGKAWQPFDRIRHARYGPNLAGRRERRPPRSSTSCS